MKVLILGGRGFLGSKIKDFLKGHEVYTFDRHPGGRRHFRGDITSFKDLKKSTKNMDIVINLVGLSPLFKPKATSYYNVHVEGVKNVLKSCKKNGVSLLAHISALGADKNSEIEYLRTKGLGQEEVESSKIKSVIFRPSVIYDKNNELISMLYKSAPTMLFPNIKTKMQLIYRSDVAKLISKAVRGEVEEKVLDIVGPNKISLHNIAKTVYNKRGFPCGKVPMFLFMPVLKIVSWIGLFGIGKDQVKSLKIENTTKENKAEKYIELTKFEDWIKKAELNKL